MQDVGPIRRANDVVAILSIAACLLVPFAARAESPPAASPGQLPGSSGTEPSQRSFLVGGDISALPVLEKAGAVYRMAGQPGDCVQILSACGWNCFRLRIFVNPIGKNVVVQDVRYTIALAKRIKATGARLLLDFHYSDTWADPGHQTKPKAWEHLTFNDLEKAVYEHTRDCIAQMKAAGVLPDMVQIGNEIDPGFLWPDGQLRGVGNHQEQWNNFGRLLKAGERGVRDAAGEEKVDIVIHVSCGGDAKQTKRFFQNVEAQGVPYDIIGLSYYPWWHGSLSDLEENLKGTAQAFEKDIFLVEAAYPYKSTKWNNQHDKAGSVVFPCTVDGQLEYFQQLLQTIRGVPSARVIGIQLWYPESITVEGVRGWFGGAMAVFDERGNLLPSARLLGESAR